MSKIAIGTRLWSFSQNRREYDDNKNIIYAYHFEEYFVIGETSRSWICSHKKDDSVKDDLWGQHKVSKKDMTAIYMTGYSRRQFYTDEERADDIWIHDNLYPMIDAIKSCKDIALLQNIARQIDYKTSK